MNRRILRKKRSRIAYDLTIFVKPSPDNEPIKNSYALSPFIQQAGLRLTTKHVLIYTDQMRTEQTEIWKTCHHISNSYRLKSVELHLRASNRANYLGNSSSTASELLALQNQM